MEGIIRKYNWQTILLQEIEKSKVLKFEYAVNDCTIWAANIIKSYTNLVWEPKWKNKKEALRYHREKPMEDRVSEVLGPYRNNLLTTQRGDLVQKDLGMDAALGICLGSQCAFLYNEGICYVPLNECTYSWRI